MKKEINFSAFVDEFRSYNREDNFSYDGLRAIFDYLEEFEDFELDVIAICCEFTEYEDVNDYLKNYGYTPSIDKEDYIEEETNKFFEDDYLDDLEEEVFKHLENNTTLLKTDGESFVIVAY